MALLAAALAAIGRTFLVNRTPTATEPQDLRWSVVQFSESGVLDSITTLDGRFVIGGADGDGPAMWFSDDGLGWGRSAGVLRNPANLDADSVSMGFLSGHGDHLVAVGNRNVTEGNESFWETALWTSQDGGKNWVDALDGSMPKATLDVVATEHGYVALGQGPNGIPTVWTSESGVEWTLVSDDSTFGDASVGALAIHDGQIVAVGARLNESGPSPAMAWRSRDGAEWQQIVLSGGDAGNAVDVVATDGGFVAVGSQRGVVTGAVAWQSADGIEWHEVVLDSDGDIGGGLVAASGTQFIAIGGKLLQKTTGLTAWSLLSPSTAAIPLELDGSVTGFAGYRDPQLINA